MSDGEAPEAKWLSGTPNKDGVRDLLAGMISGFFCKILEFPADTIKVLEQTGGARYSGPIDCARKTVAENGLMSLYNGLTAPLIGSMAECASLFVTYGYIKSILNIDSEDETLSRVSCFPRSPPATEHLLTTARAHHKLSTHRMLPNLPSQWLPIATAYLPPGLLLCRSLLQGVPMWKYILAGGGSGFASTCVLTPVELVKCRLQAQIGATAPAAGAPALFTGPLDVISRTIRAEGIAGLFRGNMSTLAREVPGNMAWFGAYEYAMLCVQRAGGYETKKEVCHAMPYPKVPTLP